MRRLLFFPVFLLSLVLGVILNQAGRMRDVYQAVCDLTQERFFRDDERLKEWVAECRRHAAGLTAYAKPEAVLKDMQDLTGLMGVSHFQVYSPEEDRALWKGEALDTGIRSRYVEDHLVIYRVLPKSAGLEAGLRAGDEILKMEGTDQVTPWGAQHRSGRFTIRRSGRVQEARLKPKTMSPDYAPHVHALDARTAVLEIPSFRSEFFEAESWRRLVAAFQSYPRLIVDVRENAGGNFVAMLRALSTLQCGGRTIGTLEQPRKTGPDKAAFDDTTDDRYQIDQLDRHQSLGLRTFSNYGCYRGTVTVLISAETSSVAEIFAESFSRRPGSRIWGQPSAGDVVLAVWYDLPGLGTGYSVSIPEATFVTPAGKELEGQGVWPQRELFYDLTQSLKGEDSWILEAAK